MPSRVHHRVVAAVLLVVGTTALLLPKARASSGDLALHSIGGSPIFAVPSERNGTVRAGGPAVAYHPGGPVITTQAVKAGAPSPRVFFTGYGGWEPTLGVDNRGTVLIAASNSTVDAELIRSSDGGQTWTASNPPLERVTLDPYIYADNASGRSFYLNLVPLGCPVIWSTDDDAATWSPSVVCGEFDNEVIYSGPSPAGGARPYRYPDVLYYCAIQAVATADASTSTECSKSLDGGRLWLPTGELAFPPRLDLTIGSPEFGICDGAVGHHGAVGPDGTVYQPRVWCGPPYLAISHDEGATWTRVQVSSIDGLVGTSQASVAVDRAGTVYFSWIGANHHPYIAISHTRGQTWSRPIDVLPPGVAQVSGFNTSIVAGGPGRIAMLYMGSPDSATTPTSATTWNAYMVESADANDPSPVLYATSLNDPSTPFNRGACGDSRCNDAGDFMDLVIGPDGRPWGSFVDQCPSGHPCPIAGSGEFLVPRGEAVLGRLVGGVDLTG